MKLRKRISLLIAIVLTLSMLSGSSLATATVDPSILEGIETALDRITQNAQEELYGLDKVDFSTIAVGSPIESYEYIDGDMAKLDFSVYPLTSEGVLVAFAVKQADSDFINVTTALVGELGAKLSTNEAFALVYDSEACYAYSQNNFIEVVSSAEVDESRDMVDSTTTMPREAKLQSLAPVQALEYEVPGAQLNSGIMARAASTYVSLPVQYVTQSPPSVYCWACCVASIGNYMRGGSLNGQDVAKSVYGNTNWNRTATLTTSLGALSNLYGINYTAYSYAPSAAVAAGKLSLGRPLFASWSSSTSSNGHASVIYGADQYYYYISVMDPEFGFINVGRNNSMQYTYVSLYDARTLTLNGYGA